jgi:hypothetical protein
VKNIPPAGSQPDDAEDAYIDRLHFTLSQDLSEGRGVKYKENHADEV